MIRKSKTTKTSGRNSLVFFGTGPVAAEALEKLVKNFEVEAVITKPIPPHHRGSFPVLKTAQNLGLKVLTATDKRSLSDLFKKKPVKSPIGLVIDFGIIISQDVIDYFPLGIVNSHFSLLPRWRGADPISFALLEGDKRTGVSLMVIDAGLDTGKLITSKVLPIAADDTSSTLTAKLIDLSDELLRSYLPKYIMGDIKPKNQPHPDRVTYSSKLNKEVGLIDWNKSAEQIEREIRAFLDWPKSRTNLADLEVIITQAHVDDISDVKAERKPGQAWIEDKQIKVQTCDKILVIDKLKPAGKSEMTAQAFLAGYRLENS